MEVIQVVESLCHLFKERFISQKLWGLAVVWHHTANGESGNDSGCTSW